MPNTDEKPESDAPAQPEPPKAAEPAYVTREELASTRELLAETIRTTIAESVRAQRAEQAVRPQDPPIEDVDDAAIDKALSEGREGVASLLRRAARAEVTRALRESKRTDIDPLRTLTESVGGKLVRRLATQDMPLYAKSEVVRKVMDEIVAGMPAQAQLDPDALVAAYDLAIGRMKRLQPKMYDDLMAVEKEATVRRAQPDDAGQAPTRSGRAPAADAVPKGIEDALTGERLANAEAALQALGRNKDGVPEGKSFDEFARSLGYDPKEYLKMIKAEGQA